MNSNFYKRPQYRLWREVTFGHMNSLHGQALLVDMNLVLYLSHAFAVIGIGAVILMM